jgi:hypothetical protein
MWENMIKRTADNKTKRNGDYTLADQRVIENMKSFRTIVPESQVNHKWNQGKTITGGGR